MSDRADELLRDVIEHWMIAYDPTELTKACERARAYLSENQPINDAAAQRASAEV